MVALLYEGEVLCGLNVRAFIHSQSHYSGESFSVSERIIHSHITSDDLRTADSD